LGQLEAVNRSVVLRPLNIEFQGEALQIR
jgi:hypothetical protein